MTTIGIVLWKSEETGLLRATIAAVSGFHYERDQKHVMEYGTKLTFDEAKGFFPNILTDRTLYAVDK